MLQKMIVIVKHARDCHMKVMITFKLTPESRQEMIEKFGLLYREFREYVEELQAKGTLPAGTIRWLIESGSSRHPPNIRCE